MNPAEIDTVAASTQTVNTAASLTADPSTDVSPRAPQLTEFDTTMLNNSEVPIGMLLDLSLPVSIELGRTSMTVQELLRLGRGSVVQLERMAGEPIDIYVGDRRFAEGEVVVLGEHFGVRITRIVQSGNVANQQLA